MDKLKFAKKILSFLTCAVLSSGFIALYPSFTDNTGSNAEAKTIAEIQEQRKANEAKIADLENQIKGLEGSQTAEQQQQEYLSEQIGYIQENITFLNAELENISNDIQTTEINIQNLDEDIISQQASIDENIELFKQRLCAMYMSGNESAASVVLGSTSFYDMMSRVQMINRVAEYEDQLINDILTEIKSLEQSKKDLEAEKLNLQMKLEEQNKRKDEKDAELVLLNDKMQSSQFELDRLAMEQLSLETDKDTLEKQNKALDDEEADILAEIKRKQEEAQRLWEENQKKIAAKKLEEAKAAKKEAARKAIEEELRRQQSTTTTTVTTTMATTTVTTVQTTAVPQNNAPTVPPQTEQPQTEPPQTEPPQTEPPQTESPQTEPVTVATEPPYVAPTVSESGFAWPVPTCSYISSYFGFRWGRNHNGIDISSGNIMGSAVVASQAGIVITVNNSCTHNYAKESSCGCGGGYGNYVVISHDGTYSTLYGHFTSAAVSVGDYVQQNDVIGYAGCTGFSTGAHLHFEVIENGVKQNPLNYVSP